MDEEDADDSATALREAKEEIGLHPSLVHVVANLKPFISLVQLFSFSFLVNLLTLLKNHPFLPHFGSTQNTKFQDYFYIFEQKCHCLKGTQISVILSR